MITAVTTSMAARPAGGTGVALPAQQVDDESILRADGDDQTSTEQKTGGCGSRHQRLTGSSPGHHRVWPGTQSVSPAPVVALTQRLATKKKSERRLV